MALLVAVKVYDLPVVTRIRSAHASGSLVVAMELLTIDEVHATDRTAPVLTLSQPHVTGSQAPEVNLPSCPPVVPQARVIRGGPAMHQRVPDDLEPPELEEVGPRVLVTKHPTVIPLSVQPAPVAVLAPLPGLVGMHALRVACGTALHPVIHPRERFGCHDRAVVIGPATDNRVEPPENGADVVAAESGPLLPQ